MREGRDAIDENLLDSWDEAIVKPGARILWNRLRYVEQMKQELPQGLFGAESLKMHYLSTVCSRRCGCAANRGMLQATSPARRARMIMRTGYTSVGPHRDDLKLYVNGKSLVDFGSAGQQRSVPAVSLFFSNGNPSKNPRVLSGVSCG